MQTQSIPSEIEWLLRLPVQVFKICFVAGTLLLALYAAFNEILIALAGYAFTAIAIIVNLIVVCLQVINSFIHRKYQKLILLYTAILLVNIPVAVLYVYIATNVILKL